MHENGGRKVEAPFMHVATGVPGTLEPAEVATPPATPAPSDRGPVKRARRFTRASGPASSDARDASNWLEGDSDVIERIRTKRWEDTPLGPIESWPETLRSTLSLTLGSSFPINVIWGEGAAQIWNDAYAAFCGEKHPAMFGSDYRVCWASAWPAIGEAFDIARAGRTAFRENQPMFLDRNGYLEETWFTFSLSPIRGEHGEVAGLLLPVTETSGQMLSERRVRVLSELSRRVDSARTVTETITGAIEVLGEAELDIPLALLYLQDQDSDHIRLRGDTGLRTGNPIRQSELALAGDSPIVTAMREKRSVLLEDLSALHGDVHAAGQEEAVERVLIVPIIPLADELPIGAIVLGVSSRLPLDEFYRGFLHLVAQNVTSSLTNARAHEGERARADGLLEIDRAKTAFFANVSHEFRTPLTLILGPLEDELAQRDLQPDHRERLSMVQRNANRLLRLVNSLLDFSRADSLSVKPQFKATDLGAFTSELAELFRYIVESAGLMFIVDCDPLPAPIFVDREMWERIVLNLLSNAFKHTFHGEIAVLLRWRDDRAELVVSDTGVGIAADELPRLFERFHRVAETRSRTVDGTGIGLALIQELVNRHGGEVRVESQQGRGSAFTVSIPGGRMHLPDALVSDGEESAATASSLAVAQADEAREWLSGSDGLLSEDEGSRPRAPLNGSTRPRVLLADDSADMRRHVARLLDANFEVTTAPDGVLALESALASPPDLVLTDMMMPRLDGFGLLAALREDERTRTIPVIMLSARAGEDSSIEAVRAGVDDYLAKPFSAKELVVRISRSLGLAKVRREAEQNLQAANAELARALSQLESIARTDPGTGLPNRRAWDEELHREIARARRNSHPLCLALLDLDHLKAHNDRYGHQAGDTLLRDAGAAWRIALRVTDLVARIGGDEFAVLMPDCTLEVATAVLRRVRHATPGNETCSAGIACWDGSESSEALVGRADAALYRAKLAGRARATISQPTPAGARGSRRQN